MAVDSLSKRFSMMDFGGESGWAIPIPDATIDQGDRQHLLWGYSGVEWDEVVDTRRYWRTRGRKFTTIRRRF